MKQYNIILLYLSVILLYSCNYRNDNNTSVPKKNNNIDSLSVTDAEVEMICNCVDQQIVSEANALPPFDKASKIVSYEFKETVLHEYENIIKDGIFQRKQIVKQIDITKWKKELEKMLFNKKIICNDGDYSLADDCAYIPRHCIVFYDKKGIATDFIEIDFKCDKIHKSTNHYLGPYCERTFCELKELFIKAGHNKEVVLQSYGPPCE